MWVDCRKNQDDDISLCDNILEKTQIAVVPGSSFGNNGKGFIRISMGCETNRLLESMKKLVEFFASISNNNMWERKEKIWSIK